jgi:hypothetical protein
MTTPPPPEHLAMTGPVLRDHLAATLNDGGHYVPQMARNAAAAGGQHGLTILHAHRHALGEHETGAVLRPGPDGLEEVTVPLVTIPSHHRPGGAWCRWSGMRTADQDGYCPDRCQSRTETCGICGSVVYDDSRLCLTGRHSDQERADFAALKAGEGT